MVYAIISDIHSNLEALSAVLERIDSIGVDEILCLGDIVGYNSNPNECIRIFRERAIRSVAGNHDVRAAGIKEPYDFNEIAREALFWTRKALTEENLSYLKALPERLYLKNGKGVAVHGALTDSTDTYILSPWIALRNFEEILSSPDLPPVCFFGHTHVKVTYQYTKGKVLTLFKDEIDLNPEDLYLINPGSVGQPRDRNPDASFLVYDTESGRVTFYRVPYDIDLCYRKIVEAGLPIELAERLKIGW